jgi:iron complex outermembrane receptor protein
MRSLRLILLSSTFSAISIAGAQAQQPELLPDLYITQSRLTPTIAGTSTTIITSEDIRRAPEATIQGILSREAGIQTWSTAGGVNGAATVVDLRGFGAFGSANTLVLINGRRLNDIDLAGVDLSTLPKDSIDHIEITRGNSGAVLYGDGAIGGTINIVTKNGINTPPSARIEGGFGSFNQRELDGSVTSGSGAGPWSVAAFGNAVGSDGWRQNNALRQYNGIVDARYTGNEGTAYLNFSADDQHLGLPGARSVTVNGINQFVTDPRGTTTPFDYADKQGQNLTLGVTRNITAETELIIDGGIRAKQQQAFATLGGVSSYIDTTLTTLSFTPRMTDTRNIGGVGSKLIAGVDFYDSQYQSDRPDLPWDPPIHRYDLHQKSLAGYGQETLTFQNILDVSFGGRVQDNSISARDRFDPNAPGAVPFFFGFPADVQGLPLDKSEVHHAYHVGFEFRPIDGIAIFGRVAHAFRIPNVDERVGSAPSFAGIPTNFDLKTQTSNDQEIGFRLKQGRLTFQSSIYNMDLQNEIHFSPATFTDVNLDPTRRRGMESIASFALTDDVLLRGSVAFIRATFVEGPFKGNDVPLVSNWTASAGVSWNIWKRYVMLDADVRFVGERRLDNDQANVQPLIPADTLVDVKLSGEIERFFWSVAVQNLTNVKYYDYGVASTFTIGNYNVYPLPGRTVMAKAGITF